MWDECAKYLAGVATAAGATQRADWIDVLHFAPKGFKIDQPSTDTFRRRLAALASGIAAEIQSPG